MKVDGDDLALGDLALTALLAVYAAVMLGMPLVLLGLVLAFA